MVAATVVKADLIVEAALFRSGKALGANAIDALEGLPLSALKLKSVSTETVGGDTLERFERG
jgi:riboflavin biosynthesis pyrimidine reductase